MDRLEYSTSCYHRGMKNEELISTQPDDVDRLLRRFAYLESAHPRSWGLFYRIVVMMHARRISWGHERLRERLVEYGLPRVRAEMYSEIYWHSRCVLHTRSHLREPNASYAKWIRGGASRLT